MAMAMGRPTRSGELRASDDMMDHRGVAIAEEGYSANRMKVSLSLPLSLPLPLSLSVSTRTVGLALSL